MAALLSATVFLSLPGGMPAQEAPPAPPPVSGPAAPPPGTNKPDPKTDPKTDPKAVNNKLINDASLAALTKFFVIAILLESGLAVVFNWTVFLAYCSRRAWKPVVMFIASLVVVLVFDQDILAKMIDIYNTADGGDSAGTKSGGLFSTVISALILAGGSAGILNLMVALKFRTPEERDARQAAPAEKHAWVSVRLTNYPANGPTVSVHIERLPADPVPPPVTMAGSVSFKRPGLVDLFLPNRSRFPSTGGYTVDAEVPYRIAVMSGGRNLLPEPGHYKFAPRAIVDLVVEYTPPPPPPAPVV